MRVIRGQEYLTRSETKQVLNHVMAILQDDAILDDLPAKTGAKVYATLGEFLHDDDLFQVAKEGSNEIGNLYFMLKAKYTIIENYFHVPPVASVLSKWQKFSLLNG